MIHTVDVDGQRWYTDEETLIVPSVTTILGVVNPYLDWWHAKQAAEYVLDNIGDTIDRKALIDGATGASERFRDHRGDLGQVVHDYVEADLLGNPSPVIEDPALAKEAKPYIDQWRRYNDAHEILPVLLEAGVVSRSGGYAGRMDIGAEHDGEMLLLDVKSGNSIRGKVKYQLAAYRYAEETFDGDPVPAFDGAAILRVRPRSCRLIPVPAGPDEYQAFRYIREVFLLAKDFNERIKVT